MINRTIMAATAASLTCGTGYLALAEDGVEERAADRWRMSIAASGKEHDELTDLLDQTLAMLDSEAFATNIRAGHAGDLVRAIPAGGGDAETISIDRILGIMRRTADNFWKFRQSVTLVGTYWGAGRVIQANVRSAVRNSIANGALLQATTTTNSQPIAA